ncbi:MAG TPA: hypothetical protein VL523_19865 [Terriglobia bacterium]|nr:hypothetical protein [Terriglobia bacterium]
MSAETVVDVPAEGSGSVAKPRLGAASCGEAARRQDHCMNVQGDRPRRAIDRNLRVLPKLLKAFGLEAPAAARTPGGESAKK